LKVNFHNRYCDVEPLRNGNESAKNRRKGDDRSRGKQGEASTLKKEYQSSEHSKTKQCADQFADELNVTAMAQQCLESSKSKERDQVMESIETKLLSLDANLKQSQ
jgi:hypothetical protein